MHPDIFSGRSEKKGGHGSAEWAVAFIADADPFISSYCNTIPTHDGGTHESRIAHRPVQGPARPRQPRRTGKARGSGHQRRRDVDRGRDDLGLHPRAGIPGPDQGPPRDRRSRAHRRTGGARSVRSLARRQSAAGQQAARFRDRARGRAHPPPAGKGRRAQERGAQTAPARQARRLHQFRRRRAPKSSSSRATAPAARPNRRATAPRQAVLPLRGKILNVASAGKDKLAQNQQLADLVQALGCRHRRALSRAGSALREGHHHDRRRRRRRAYRVAADHVLLPADAEADRGRASFHRGAAALSADAMAARRSTRATTSTRTSC